MKKSNSIAWKITGKLCLWMLIIVIGVSVFFFNFTLKTMSALYAENFHNKIDGDTAKWSDPFYDGYDNKTALAAYMVPIHDTNGKAIAVLGAYISLDWLTEKLAETDSAYNATG